MRLDKFLKDSRLIKRRTIAQELCKNGRVLINDRPAKPGSLVKIDDTLTISFGTQKKHVQVLKLPTSSSKIAAEGSYLEL
ncbi:MAG: hypothetical protein RLZ12_760 [Bacillota bacterium]|jgi:ribosomal 50S subunit-recycling heat shock protein